MQDELKKLVNPNFSGVTSDGSYSTGGGQTTLPPVISSSSLTPAPNLNIPPATPPVNYQPSASASLDALLASYNAPLQEETNQNDLQQQILTSLGSLGQESTRKTELETAQGLPEQRKELQGVINQLQGLQKEAAAIPLQIQQEFQGRGVTAGGVAPIQADRLRENAIKSLGLAAIGQVLQNNIALAESNIKESVRAEFEPERNKLEVLKQLYEFNKDALSRADAKRTDALGLLIKERERVLSLREDDRSAGSAMALAAIKNFPKNVAAQRAAQQVLELDVNDPNYLQNVFSLVGQYQQDPASVQQSILEQEYKKAQIANLYAEAKKTSQSTAAAGRVANITAQYGSTDYYRELFAASGGGKDLTGDQTTPLTKAAIVLGQVSELAAQINQTTTDPILGILRDNNPYDVKARLIQAQLRATVPNLARGVYGEVGVLTDTDIANYIQTLPNIRTPQEANKLVLAMTLGTIKSSFEAYLESYANAGRDVSGFSKQYEAIDKKISDIKTELGITSGGSNDPYATARANTPAGQVLIIRNGQAGYIPMNEFNLKTDTFPPGPMSKL